MHKAARLVIVLSATYSFLWTISNHALGAPASSPAGVAVSPDLHWLTFRNKPTLLVGDSVTQGWMELGTDFDQTAYVDALASRKINVLMLWSYIGITDQTVGNRIGYDAPEIWPWVKNGRMFDLGRFNNAYFNRLRSLARYANEKDIVVLITVHDGWAKTRFPGHPFNQALGGPLTRKNEYVELADYGKEMPATFDPGWDRRHKHQYYLERFCNRLLEATGQHPNVIYEMFNEGEWYNQKDLRAFQVHFLRFFKSRSPRLTFVNADSKGLRGFRSEADCDVISLHFPNWKPDTPATLSFQQFASEFVGTPLKPYFFTEPVPEYQGDASWHDGQMRLMWGTLIGGAGFVVQNDTSFGFAPRSKMVQYAKNRDAMLDLEGHAARFFNDSGVNFASMSPNASLSSTGVCLANPAHEYVVYAQSGDSFTLNLSAETRDVTARFYNPRTGEFRETFKATGRGPRSFTKPDSNDWVLHLKALH